MGDELCVLPWVCTFEEVREWCVYVCYRVPRACNTRACMQMRVNTVYPIVQYIKHVHALAGWLDCFLSGTESLGEGGREGGVKVCFRVYACSCYAEKRALLSTCLKSKPCFLKIRTHAPFRSPPPTPAPPSEQLSSATGAYRSLD
jgi:hypothetical protein